MANRYFTLMLIPERSSHVKKWIVQRRWLYWAAGVAAFLVVMGVTTSIFTLRYLARHGEFQEALLKNQYLEGKLQSLQNSLNTTDSTLVRIQNFEQKLRVLARLEPQTNEQGIGPISQEEEQLMEANNEGGKNPTLVASAESAPKDYGYRMKSLELSIDDLSGRASLREQSLQELYELLKDQESLLSSTPSVWPAKGWVTSQFGYRVSPFTGMRVLHEGLDIAAPAGSKVVAPADAVVTYAGTDESYGKVIALNHGYGVVTRFGHLAELRVRLGQRVRRGDNIGLVGNTGRSTGTHLHYEVRLNGIPVNPSRYILN